MKLANCMQYCAGPGNQGSERISQETVLLNPMRKRAPMDVADARACKIGLKELADNIVRFPLFAIDIHRVCTLALTRRVKFEAPVKPVRLVTVNWTIIL